MSGASGRISDLHSAVLQFIDNVLAPLLHDRMTQCRYRFPVETFNVVYTAQPVRSVDVMAEGRAALVRANTELGLLTELHLFVLITVESNLSFSALTLENVA